MELFYREMGTGAQPIIILHGLFGASDNWMSIGKQLAETHKVYILDQRNHGQSENTPEFDYPTMAADLHEFITTHQLENAIIIGHSMGGKVAMQFAVNHPNLYDKLVVVDIAPKAYPVHHTQILEGLNALQLEDLKSRSEADKALQQYIPEMGVRQFLLKNLYRQAGGFAWRINLPVISQKIESVGKALDFTAPNENPTLFIGGKKSHYIQDEDHSLIHEVFTNAQIVMLENVGHWVHAEAPRKFITLLKDFID